MRHLQLRISSKISAAFVLFLALAIFVQASSAQASGNKAPTSNVSVFKSTALPNGVQGLQAQAEVQFKPQSGQDPLLTTFDVDPLNGSQIMEGFGGAMTESCAINLNRLTPALRHEALEKLFSKTAGAGFDVIRLPMGASDFAESSLGSYTYDDPPGSSMDPGLHLFSMNRDEKSFALIREAKAINPNLRVLITPWSPPAWMKTSQDLKAGTLSPAHFQDLANYFSRTIREYRARSIPVEMMTIQNEPGYATTDYPSMSLSVNDQIKFISDFLGPQLERDKVSIRIYAHDHNYSMVDDVNSILDDPKASKYVSGVAYHCYSGDRSQMNDSMSRHPGIPTIQSECTAIGVSEAQKDFNWWLDNQSVGGVNQGTTGAIAWNLCLDEQYGPKNGGCPNCRGLIETDFSKATPELHYNPEYFALAQVSRFIVPGAQRLNVKVTTPKVHTIASPPMNASDVIESTAYRNPAGDFVFVAHNPGSVDLKFKMSQSGAAFVYDLPAQSAVTFTWR